MSLKERLRFARERLQLTLQRAAEETGIGVSSLSEFETGKREPRIHQLQKLAEAYRQSIEFFFAEGRIVAPQVLWRAKPEGPPAAETEAKFLRLCEQYRNLEVWCGEEKTLSLPTAEKQDPAEFGYDDAENLAYEVWKRLQLGDRPGQSLLRVAEEACGIKVFHLNFEPTGTAACTRSESFGAAVLLNAGNARWRRNFDLAHELFHLLTWKVFRDPKEGPDAVAEAREEKLATCFASRLLMPTDVTKQALEQRFNKKRQVTVRGLFDVAREFDVSVESLLWRMSFLYDRNEATTKKDIGLCQESAAKWEKRASDDPPSRPMRFQALAVRALQDGEISQGRFAEYMGMGRGEAGQFLEGMPRNGEKENTITVA